MVPLDPILVVWTRKEGIITARPVNIIIIGEGLAIQNQKYRDLNLKASAKQNLPNLRTQKRKAGNAVDEGRRPWTPQAQPSIPQQPNICQLKQAIGLHGSDLLAGRFLPAISLRNRHCWPCGLVVCEKMNRKDIPYE